jgi:hypothetical protein
MKLLAYFSILVLLLGCKGENIQSSSHQEQTKVEEYPTKVVKLLSLIQKLEPGTDELSWLEHVDKEIQLPEEDVIIDGGGGLGESWLTIGIGAGDEWALSIESYMHNRDNFNERQIWEARVIKTSIAKALANEPHEVQTIFPYYLKGHLMWKETRPGDVKEKKVESGPRE